MRDLWATIGACCIDEEVRKTIKSELGKTPPGLEEIQKLLRKRCGINLSRWELEEMERLYTQYNGSGQSVLDMMEKAGSFLGMNVAPEDRELCAAIGLACIDEGYRRDLWNACAQGDPNQTADLAELLQEKEENPRFKDLGQPDLQRLNRMMARGKDSDGKEVWQWMKLVQDTGWESPQPAPAPPAGAGKTYPACSVGYRFDARPYLHVSQPKLAEVLADSTLRVIDGSGNPPSLMEFLKQRKVLQ